MMTLPKGVASKSYRPRVFGLALGFLMMASVFHQEGAPWWVWLGPALHGLIWPHVAWGYASHAADPVRAESHNMLIDRAATGMWMAAMAFNLLPSVLIVTLLAMDSIIVGGRALLLRGLLAQAGGVVLGLLVYGAHWRPDSSMLQIWACMPLLMTYPLVIGHITHKAVMKLEQQRAELSRLNRHDALSELYNRGWLDNCIRSQFERSARAGEAATLAMLDLDHFKRVNDTLGHQAGDEAIRALGRRLKALLRSTDVAGRYGGEEFAVLLPHTRAAEAAPLMQRLRESLSSDPLLPGHVLTVSMGVAELTPDIASPEGWVRLADQMLYRAKNRGRNRVEIAGADVLAAATQALPADPHLMHSLAQSTLGATLFDPADRLVWFNASVTAVFPQAAAGETFSDLVRRCHQLRSGACVQTQDIDEWLRAANTKRRSRPQRSFRIDLYEGGLMRVEETSLGDGWLLALFLPLSDDAPPTPEQVVRLLPEPVAH
jgi:diguanylate cyclase (GGDEF)-like protein